MPLPPVQSNNNLASLAESSFRKMFNAKSKEEFDSVFDGFVAERANVTMNGKPVSRSHYKEHLWRDHASRIDPSSAINFKEAVGVSR